MARVRATRTPSGKQMPAARMGGCAHASGPWTGQLAGDRGDLTDRAAPRFTGSAPPSTASPSPWRRAAPSSCSGRTGPARRRSCGSSRPCCGRARQGRGARLRAARGGLAAAGRVGYLGHEPLLYRDLSSRREPRFHARLHGIPEREAAERIGFLLAAVGMERRADQRTEELSAGMRQRIAICRCVLHEPALLLLDEPDSTSTRRAGSWLASWSAPDAARRASSSRTIPSGAAGGRQGARPRPWRGAAARVPRRGARPGGGPPVAAGAPA
jgi:energy-coupling factor transporter ATP-binding protein EcfA2